MGRRMMSLCVMALLVLPVAGALALPAVQVPPGLLNAKAKLQVAFTNQMANETARYERLSAKINALLAPLQELQDQADELQGEITDLQTQLTAADAADDTELSLQLNAEILTDQDQLADLQDQIAAMQDDLANVLKRQEKLEQQHTRKMDKLDARYQQKTEKFKLKITKWQEKHGDFVPPPPPQPDGDPPQ